REHAVLQVGAHVVTVDPRGQGEGARERPVRAFAGVEGVALLVPLLFAAPRDRQPVAGQRNLEVGFLHARQVGAEHVRVLGFGDLEGRREGALAGGEHRVELAVRVPPQHVPHEAERIPVVATRGGRLLRLISPDEVCHRSQYLLPRLGINTSPQATSAGERGYGSRPRPRSSASSSATSASTMSGAGPPGSVRAETARWGSSASITSAVSAGSTPRRSSAPSSRRVTRRSSARRTSRPITSCALRKGIPRRTSSSARSV